MRAMRPIRVLFSCVSFSSAVLCNIPSPVSKSHVISLFPVCLYLKKKLFKKKLNKQLMKKKPRSS